MFTVSEKLIFTPKAVSKEIFQLTMIIYAIYILFISTSTWKQNGNFFVLKLANISYYKANGSNFSALENQFVWKMNLVEKLVWLKNCCIYSQY